MKTVPNNRHRFLVPFLGIFIFCLAFASQPSFAGSPYTTTVTIHEYYGLRGKDTDGNRLYGVKVHSGNHFYYVELHHPMPCLKSHLHEKAYVTIDRHNDCWGDVTFEGHSAKVHNVIKLESDDDRGRHDDHASNHNHRQPIPSPFETWRALFK